MHHSIVEIKVVYVEIRFVDYLIHSLPLCSIGLAHSICIFFWTLFLLLSLYTCPLPQDLMGLEDVTAADGGQVGQPFRRYRWGSAFPLNRDHSDLIILKQLLFGHRNFAVHDLLQVSCWDRTSNSSEKVLQSSSCKALLFGHRNFAVHDLLQGSFGEEHVRHCNHCHLICAPWSLTENNTLGGGGSHHTHGLLCKRAMLLLHASPKHPAGLHSLLYPACDDAYPLQDSWRRAFTFAREYETLLRDNGHELASATTALLKVSLAPMVDALCSSTCGSTELADKLRSEEAKEVRKNVTVT
jgi:hypothetical protein